jgi:hypothetical protein
MMPKPFRPSVGRLEKSARTLELDILRVSLKFKPDINGYNELHYRFFVLLNPKRVRLEVRDRPHGHTIWIFINEQSEPLLLPWWSVESLELKGMIPYKAISEGERAGPVLLGIPPPPHGLTRQFRFHLPSLQTYQGESAMRGLMSDRMCKSNYTKGSSGSVVFLMRSPEEKTKTEAYIQADVSSEWRSVFAVEIET